MLPDNFISRDLSNPGKCLYVPKNDSNAKPCQELNDVNLLARKIKKGCRFHREIIQQEEYKRNRNKRNAILRERRKSTDV